MEIKSIILEENEVIEALENYIKKQGLDLKVTDAVKQFNYSNKLVLAVEPKEQQQLSLGLSRDVACSL